MNIFQYFTCMHTHDYSAKKKFDIDYVHDVCYVYVIIMNAVILYLNFARLYYNHKA